ncbi:MAG: tryptophan synthase subunit alpha [Fibrobacterota bacterium]
MAVSDEKVLSDAPIKMMTHIVCGYPDFESNADLVKVMAKAGVSMVEIQLPFSDPLADGPSIMKANQQALSKGISTADCIRKSAEICAEVDIPVFFMTYANIVFRYGFEKFLNDAAESGIAGLIVPDIPYDSPEGEIINLCGKYGLKYIPVISPGMKKERLIKVAGLSSGVLYTTLRVGTTGSQKKISEEALLYLNSIRKYTISEIAAGFGISSPSHVAALRGHADIAVIGSRILEIAEQEGVSAVGEFISDCLRGSL